MKNSKELEHLKKVIADPKTGEEEKKRFQNIVDRIEGRTTVVDNEGGSVSTEPITEPKPKRSHHKKKDDLDKLIGRVVFVYYLGIQDPEKKRISKISITPDTYSSRYVTIETDKGIESKFPLSKFNEFINENDIKINGGKDSYIIKLSPINDTHVKNESNKKAIPDCDELVAKYKKNKKERLERQFKKVKDHRAPDTKLRDEADKKVTAIINNLKKLSIKNKVSGKVRKDILTILKQGIKHAEKS